MKLFVRVVALWTSLVAGLAVKTVTLSTIVRAESAQATYSDVPTPALRRYCRQEFYRCVDECKRPKDIDCFPKCCHTLRDFNALCPPSTYEEYCPGALGQATAAEPQSLPSGADAVIDATTATSVDSRSSDPDGPAAFPDAAAGESLAARVAIPPDHPGSRIGLCVGHYTVCRAGCTSTYGKDCDHECACQVITESGGFCRTAGYRC